VRPSPTSGRVNSAELMAFPILASPERPDGRV
jgi:hypothetical protein